MRISWASWRPKGRRHSTASHLSISWKGDGSSRVGQGRYCELSQESLEKAISSEKTFWRSGYPSLCMPFAWIE